MSSVKHVAIRVSGVSSKTEVELRENDNKGTSEQDKEGTAREEKPASERND
jgi:hypothetical protein